MLALQSATGHNTATYDARIIAIAKQAHDFIASIDAIKLDSIVNSIVYETDVLTSDSIESLTVDLRRLHNDLLRVAEVISENSEF